jgi:hypothetical protein
MSSAVPTECRLLLVLGVACSLALGGCPDPGAEPADGGLEQDAAAPDGGSAADGGDDTCPVRGQAQALSVVDRSILGSPADYVADDLLQAREAELAGSQRARREAAWRIVERVLRPVELSRELANSPASTLPAFQTWHSREDVTRIFNRIYPQLSPAERKARAPLSEAAIRAGFSWNDQAIADFPEWTSERLAEYMNAVDEAGEVAGLAGIHRVAYAPEASRHLMASYPEVLRCQEREPGDRSPPPAVGEETLVDRALDVARCSAFQLEPIALEDEDESVEVRFHEASAGALVAAFTPEGENVETSCEPRPAASCQFEGPGVLTVRARTEGQPLTGRLEVLRRRTTRAWAPCLRDAFPAAAVVVKADWRRAEFGLKLPVYDTSASALTERLTRGDASWTEPDGQANPGPDDIYTLKLPNGNVFRLAALHIMTKELDHWFWVTLWWSDRPDEDFGADRPASLPAAFRHYKMCATVAFAEGDADAGGGFDAAQPSLAAALRATHAGQGGPTWCSNPYLELGAGNSATNCVGCHQHAGTGTDVEAILGDEEAFPAHGRTELREDFLHDYSFQLERGDGFGAMFRQAETHFAE